MKRLIKQPYKLYKEWAPWRRKLRRSREKVAVLRATCDRLTAEARDLQVTRNRLAAEASNLQTARDRLAKEAGDLRKHLASVETESARRLSEIHAMRAQLDHFGRLRTIIESNVVTFLFKLALDRAPTPPESARFCMVLTNGGTLEDVFETLSRMAGPRGANGTGDPSNRVSRKDVPFPSDISREQGIFPIHIVDVGAQSLDFQDHVYAPLLRQGECRVIGFEPLEEEAARRSEREAGIVMLPYFVGDGGSATFHINAMNATSSLYASNPRILSRYRGLAIVCRTMETTGISTRRLDDISEVRECDYLKIDVQGGELDVLKGATQLLNRVSWIHLEVEFDQVYLDQPLFTDIDIFLRGAGFELIDLLDRGYDAYDVGVEGPGGRLLWADALYMRRDDELDAGKLLKAAYIAHVNYGKFDLAGYLIRRYDTLTGNSYLPNYLNAVNTR